MSMSCREPVAGFTAQAPAPTPASMASRATQRGAVKWVMGERYLGASLPLGHRPCYGGTHEADRPDGAQDRKSTRLNSSHGYISYAVFCLKKKKQRIQWTRNASRRAAAPGRR